MASRLDIGEVVAAQMQQIVQSDEHKRIFFKGASEKCCSCVACGKECPCKDKCVKGCKGCEDKNHVHDSNCAHDKTAGAVNEMIDLLQKISSVQDELGLVNSSIFTMKALAMMVAELKKSAQDDTNDVSFEELIGGIRERDPELLEELGDEPDILALLRQRVRESEEGKKPAPFDFALEGVSADPTTPLPSSEPPPEFGDVVIEPEEHPTWSPGSARHPTLPAVEKIPGFQPPPGISVPERKYVSPGQSIESGGDLPPPYVEVDKGLERPTVPVRTHHLGGGLWSEEEPIGEAAKQAFKRLNDLMKKYAEDGDDFEEEEEDDAEFAALMKDIAGGPKMTDRDHENMLRGHELAEMLFSEEPEDRELFDVPLDADDNMYASDVDGELESGDFLGSPDEDGGPGFSYRGPDELYDNTHLKKVVGPLPKPHEHVVAPHMVEYDLPEKSRDPHDVVRVGPGKWKRFDELSPEERLELEMGAGLHEQLDMDPDELTTEEVYPEYWEEGPEEEEISGRLSNELDKYDDGEWPEDLMKRYRFWSDKR